MRIKTYRKNKRKKIILMASLCLICVLGIGTTLAYLTNHTEPVVNEFTPGEVTTTVDEEFEEGVKTDVSIQNTGNVKAYIRATVIVTWQDEQGNVAPIAPVEDTDYEIAWYNEEGTQNNSNWMIGADGFYYHKPIVEPGEKTSLLFTDCKLKDGVTPPDGYYLNVEILGSGIQADGTTSSGIPAVEDAWKVVTVDTDKTLKAKE